MFGKKQQDIRMRKLDQLRVYALYDKLAEEWSALWCTTTDAHAEKLACRSVRPEDKNDVTIHLVAVQNLIDGEVSPVSPPVVIPWKKEEVKDEQKPNV